MVKNSSNIITKTIEKGRKKATRNAEEYFKTIITFKGSTLEIFVAEIFTQIRPVWAGDIGTRPKNPKCLCFGPYITLYFPIFLF
jgi:hypothetical protein